MLAILVLVYYVWGTATATPLVSSQVSPIIAPRMVQLQPSASQHHGQSSIEVILQAAENLFLQIASYSILLPRETTSALWVVQSATFRQPFSLGAAANTVCCFKSTLLVPNEYRPPKVRNWLSAEPVPKGYHCKHLDLWATDNYSHGEGDIVGCGHAHLNAEPETDDLFHPAAALLYLLFCIDLILGQPKTDLALIAVVLFPQLVLAAMPQLAALAVPILFRCAVWFQGSHMASSLLLTLHDLWHVALTMVTGLFCFILMMCYVTGGPTSFYLLGAVLFTPTFMQYF